MLGNAQRMAWIYGARGPNVRREETRAQWFLPQVSATACLPRNNQPKLPCLVAKVTTNKTESVVVVFARLPAQFACWHTKCSALNHADTEWQKRYGAVAVICSFLWSRVLRGCLHVQHMLPLIDASTRANDAAGLAAEARRIRRLGLSW